MSLLAWWRSVKHSVSQRPCSYSNWVIQTHASQIAQAQSALVEAEHKLKRFQHVLDTRKSTIAGKRMRQEQKQMDEMASQMAARQSRQAKEHI